jgi:hypothetical protein
MGQTTIGLPTQKCWVGAGDRGKGKGEDLKPFPFALSPFPFKEPSELGELL